MISPGFTALPIPKAPANVRHTVGGKPSQLIASRVATYASSPCPTASAVAVHSSQLRLAPGPAQSPVGVRRTLRSLSPVDPSFQAYPASVVSRTFISQDCSRAVGSSIANAPRNSEFDDKQLQSNPVRIPSYSGQIKHSASTANINAGSQPSAHFDVIATPRGRAAPTNSVGLKPTVVAGQVSQCSPQWSPRCSLNVSQRRGPSSMASLPPPIGSPQLGSPRLQSAETRRSTPLQDDLMCDTPLRLPGTVCPTTEPPQKPKIIQSTEAKPAPKWMQCGAIPCTPRQSLRTLRSPQMQSRSVLEVPAGMVTPRMTLRGAPTRSVPPSPMVQTRAEVHVVPLQQLPETQTLKAQQSTAAFNPLPNEAHESTCGVTTTGEPKVTQRESEISDQITLAASSSSLQFGPAVTSSSVKSNIGEDAYVAPQTYVVMAEADVDPRMTPGPSRARSVLDSSQTGFMYTQGQCCHEPTEAAAAMATAKQALQEVAELKELLKHREEELANQRSQPVFDAACYLSSDEVRAQLKEQIYQKKPPSVRQTLPGGPLRQQWSDAAMLQANRRPAQMIHDRSKLSL